MSLSEKKPFLINSIVFVFVPLFLGLSTMFYSLDRLDEHLREKQHRGFFQKLENLFVAQDGGLSFLQPFRHLLIEIRYSWGDNNFIQRNIEVLGEELKAPVWIYVFQYGKAIFKGTPHEEDQLVHDIIGALPTSSSDLADEAGKLDPRIAAQMDKNLTLAEIQRKNGEFFLFGPATQNRLGYFEIRPDGLGIVFLSGPLPAAMVREFRDRERALVSWKQWMGKGIPESGIWYPPLHRSNQEMQTAYALAQRDAKNRIESRGHSWFFIKDRWGEIFTLAVPLAEYSRVVPLAKTGLLVFSGLVALGWLLTLKRGDVGFVRFFGSIQNQLWALFFYITLLPLLAALGVGFVALGDQTEQLRHSGFKSCFEQIQVMEGSYPEGQQKFLGICRGIRNNPLAMELKPGLASFADDLRQDRNCNYVLLFGPEQEILFHNLFNRDKALLMAIQGLCRQGVTSFASNRLDPTREKKFSTFDLVVEGMVMSDDMGWSTLVQYRNQVHEMRLARATIDLYWDVYPELASGPAFIGVIIDRDQILMKHLVNKFVPIDGQGNVQFMHLISGRFLNKVNPPDEDILQETLYIAERTNQVVQRELELASGTAWVVAMPDSMINRVGLLSRRFADASLSKLAPFKAALAAGFLLSLLVAGLAARVLAGLFLVPIGDLTEGIEAIRLRQTNVRLPKRREDEFGALVSVFNRMLAELHELEIARIVQGQLLPKELPVIDGYEIAARNISATDLGGDYFDLVPLPEGGLLAIMGDATGHGVSAALAMAMAKATVSHCVLEPRHGADDLMQSLNHVFFEELRAQRKFMTLLLAILNPQEHSLEFRNSGHPFPIFYRIHQGKLEMPDMIGFPLGMKKKPQFFSGTAALAAGDSMLMFTDGYTECETADEQFIENSGIRKAYEESASKGLSAQKILEHLFEVFEAIRKPGPLGDDVTILVIRRRP